MHTHMHTHKHTHTHTHTHMHTHTLRYHHNAYFAQEVGVVVRQQAPTKFSDYLQLMFDQQDSKQEIEYTQSACSVRVETISKTLVV